MSTTVTLTGRLGADPELRFTAGGKPVVSFTMVTSKSVKNKETDAWEESETTWWRCTAWDQMAENLTEAFTKGDAVIVVGRAYSEKYTTKEGVERQTLSVQVYNAGPDLRWAKSVKRSVRSSAPVDDPWATGSVTPVGDAPPF